MERENIVEGKDLHKNVDGRVVQRQVQQLQWVVHESHVEVKHQNVDLEWRGIG